MDTEALISSISKVIQDGSFDDDDILAYINEGLEAVAGEVPLKFLEVRDTINAETTNGYVALPEDYHDHLRFVYSNTTKRRIKIYPDLARLLEKTQMTGVGVISRCCVSGGNLHYTPIPSSVEELQVIYHKMPEPYEGDEDEDNVIPSHIGPRILRAYACMEIWNIIEDGTEGPQVNTQKWGEKYNLALAELKLYMGPFYTRPNNEMESTDEMGL